MGALQTVVNRAAGQMEVPLKTLLSSNGTMQPSSVIFPERKFCCTVTVALSPPFHRVMNTWADMPTPLTLACM